MKFFVMIRNQEWKLIDILIAFGIMIFAGGILAYCFLKLHLSERFPEQLLIVVGALLMTLSGTIFLFLKYPIDLYYFGFTRTKFRETLVWGGIGGLAVSLLGFPFALIVGENNIPQEFFIGFQNGKYNVLVFLFTVIVLVPFVEEMFYRACLYRILRNRFDVFWGYVGSTALFTLSHALSQPREVIFFIINSSILTYIYEKTNSIGTSIVAHAFWSFTWFGAIYIHEIGLIP